ncbi:APC family permease [Lactobacillus psittaci]|nr:amino acid permease [Lactobacillus psittaci]
MKKQITFSQALATLVGSVIGSGVFFKISTISKQSLSPSISLWVWIIAGILSLASALTIAEVAAELPVDGSIEYLNHTYGNLWGFLFGWAQIIVYFPAEISANSAIFGVQATNLFGLKYSWQLVISLMIVSFAFFINLFGNNFSGKLQQVLTIVKLIPLLLIVAFGLFAPQQNFDFTNFVISNKVSLTTALSGGVLAALFAFDGWITVTNLAGEMKNVQKDMARALVWGIAIVTTVYVLVNLVFLKTLPFSQIIGNQNTALDTSKILFGGLGGRLITIGILISCYGAINGFMITGMRAPFILSKQNLLPFSDKFSYTTKKTEVPVFSALIIWLLSALMISLGSFDVLTDILVFVMWFFTILLTLCQPILRIKEPNLNRPFKVPFYPVTPIVALLGGIFIIIMTVINKFWLSMVGIGLTALGLPIYLYKLKQNNK